MALGAVALPPIGHRLFCHEHPRECVPDPRAASLAPVPLELTDATIRRIATLNRRVNGTIKPTSDGELYGVEEHWTYPVDRGDCEDYVLLKRRLLHRLDRIALGDLLITVVKKADGEGHAVLTLRTTRGDFVLDNLDWRIRLWNETPYTFVKRQSSVDPGRWVDIEDDSDVLVGSVRK